MKENLKYQLEAAAVGRLIIDLMVRQEAISAMLSWSVLKPNEEHQYSILQPPDQNEGLQERRQAYQ